MRWNLHSASYWLYNLGKLLNLLKSSFSRLWRAASLKTCDDMWLLSTLDQKSDGVIYFGKLMWRCGNLCGKQLAGVRLPGPTAVTVSMWETLSTQSNAFMSAVLTFQPPLSLLRGWTYSVHTEFMLLFAPISALLAFLRSTLTAQRTSLPLIHSLTLRITDHPPFLPHLSLTSKPINLFGKR